MMNKYNPSELRHNTLNQGGVVLLGAEDEEEDLVAEGAKLFVIIVDSRDIFPKIALIHIKVFML